MNDKYSKGLAYCKLCSNWIRPVIINDASYCNFCKKRVRKYAIVRKKNREKLEAQGIIKRIS